MVGIVMIMTSGGEKTRETREKYERSIEWMAVDFWNSECLFRVQRVKPLRFFDDWKRNSPGSIK